MDPDSRSNRTMALRVWPSDPATRAALWAALNSGWIFTTPV
ncbi:hypothetical protein I551_2937 [Mycobacterium ulcerans str. Harvey]|uniref:Uncharacterized protein n=1 Tax=Mycobacterium ulcerans str. Harvey TaxID=1299332 RepID=A0ABN0R0G1_MYCUL|nr:hypothetical protein I551_2937 [Mycobacterium ulcerans str. Harvey]